MNLNPTTKATEVRFIYEHVHIGRLKNIKLLSLDASSRLVALGAESGSIYLFREITHRQEENVSVSTEKDLMIESPPHKDRQNVIYSSADLSCVIPGHRSDSGVTRLSISQNENWIIAGYSTGDLVLLSLKIENTKTSAKVHHHFSNYTTYSICGLCWDSRSEQFFVGDENGSVLAVRTKKDKRPGAQLYSSHTLFTADTPIVQIGLCSSFLVVSTHRRSVIIDIDGTTGKKTALQIGKKMRVGVFGACFGANSETVYASRRGQRLWVVDRVTGTVQRTIKKWIKQPPTSCRRGDKGDTRVLPVENLDQNFSQLLLLPPRRDTSEADLLFCWNESVFFVLDPGNGVKDGELKRQPSMVEWHTDFGHITDVKVWKTSTFGGVYVLHEDSRGETCLSSIVILHTDQLLSYLNNFDNFVKVETVLRMGIVQPEILSVIFANVFENCKAEEEDDKFLSTMNKFEDYCSEILGKERITVLKQRKVLQSEESKEQDFPEKIVSIENKSEQVIKTLSSYVDKDDPDENGKDDPIEYKYKKGVLRVKSDLPDDIGENVTTPKYKSIEKQNFQSAESNVKVIPSRKGKKTKKGRKKRSKRKAKIAPIGELSPDRTMKKRPGKSSSRRKDAVEVGLSSLARAAGQNEDLRVDDGNNSNKDIINASAVEHLLNLPVGTDNELDAQLQLLRSQACDDDEGIFYRFGGLYNRHKIVNSSTRAASCTLLDAAVGFDGQFLKKNEDNGTVEISTRTILSQMKSRLGTDSLHATEVLRSRIETWMEESPREALLISEGMKPDKNDDRLGRNDDATSYRGGVRSASGGRRRGRRRRNVTRDMKRQLSFENPKNGKQKEARQGKGLMDGDAFPDLLSYATAGSKKPTAGVLYQAERESISRPPAENLQDKDVAFEAVNTNALFALVSVTCERGNVEALLPRIKVWYDTYCQTLKEKEQNVEKGKIASVEKNKSLIGAPPEKELLTLLFELSVRAAESNDCWSAEETKTFLRSNGASNMLHLGRIAIAANARCETLYSGQKELNALDPESSKNDEKAHQKQFELFLEISENAQKRFWNSHSAEVIYLRRLHEQLSMRFQVSGGNAGAKAGIQLLQSIGRSNKLHASLLILKVLPELLISCHVIGPETLSEATSVVAECYPFVCEHDILRASKDLPGEGEIGAISTMITYLCHLMRSKPKSRNQSRAHRILRLCMSVGLPSPSELFAVEAEDEIIELRVRDGTISWQAARAGAHKLVWKFGPVAMKILRQRAIFPYDQLFVLELFLKKGFFKGAIYLWLHASDGVGVNVLTSSTQNMLQQIPPLTASSGVIDLVLQLDDTILLKELVSSLCTGELKESSVPRLEGLLKKIAKRLESKETNGSITILSALNSIADVVGGEATLQLLDQVPEAIRSITPNALVNVTETARKSILWSQYANQVLNQVDRYLLSERSALSNILPPQLRAMLTLELKLANGVELKECDERMVHFLSHDLKQRKGSIELNNDSSKLKWKNTTMFRFKLDKELPRYYEEIGLHWGVRTSLDKQICCNCTLPLIFLREKENQVPGKRDEVDEIVIFPCGHAFHRVCAPQEVCPKCQVSVRVKSKIK